MIPNTMTADALEQLWDLTRGNKQRMRVGRVHETATDDAIFTLTVTNHEGELLVEVTTKNLESAAQWILDNYTKGRRK